MTGAILPVLADLSADLLICCHPAAALLGERSMGP